MPFPTPSARRRLGSMALAASLLAAACGSSAADTAAQPAGAVSEASTASQIALDGDAITAASGSTPLFDSGVIHSIEVAFDEEAYAEMVAAFEATGEKDWIEATVEIDGTTFQNVGVRLKGNSSLFSLTTATAGQPEELPWLISLDKYVDGQNYQGYVDVVIRSNSTETAMNEAVALQLLGEAGLATQQAIATSFTVNGGPSELRLAIEHPDEVWEEANFGGGDTALYKADSEGDYSDRGDDPEAYDDVFDQKVGEDDLEPLIAFLDFINNSDDATFAAELGEWLDVESFATYLAFHDLIANFDDIDGRGNNSYLHYDGDTGVFTVVSWDLNLAFATANVGGGGPPGGGGAARPVPADGAVGGGPPARAGGLGRGDTVGGGPTGPGAGGSNVLASRFLADDAFAAMYDRATTELTQSLFASGVADAIVEEWVDVLSSSTGELVGVATVESDAAAITAMFPTS